MQVIACCSHRIPDKKNSEISQLDGEDPGKLAYFFHRELACQITAACVKIRELSGCNKAALSGGVFQNRLLLELTDHMLLEQGFEVLKHQLLAAK